MQNVKLVLTVMAGCFVGGVPVGGAALAEEDDVQAPVSHRFASAPADVAEVPDFQRHVVPLIGKLGCNGRACHGSFQGRGGFRLSLFGYDFRSDHDELSGRLDPETPEDSLILQKPLMQIPHEGGRRLREGSWEHHLLRKWVESDAPPRAESPDRLLRLDVTPAEIRFTEDGQTEQLTAVAVWSDGTREDVTPLCRFQSNDDQIAGITSEGSVQAGSSGDTHVVVFYDSAVVPVPVLRPVSDAAGDAGPDGPPPTEVDRLVVQKLRKLGIVQSDLCTDDEFLRRASLDVTGTLPTPAEILAFREDSRADKRSRKIDELLERPGYAAWWTTLLCDFTGNSDDQLNNVTPVRSAASRQWYDWIHKRVKDNVGYDDIVEGIVLAVSRDPGESYEEYCRNISALYGKDATADFADRTWLPHYWARRNFQSPEDRVIGFAYTFLGTRIQCAQCHKHPFDQWTQEDFRQFEGFFRNTVGRVNNPRPDSRDEYQAMLRELESTKGLKGGQLRRALAEELQNGAVVPFGEVYTTKARPANQNARRRNRNTGATEARLLGGETIDLTEYEDAREPLMEWLRSPDNPLFAKAFVNRVWAAYFNVGIVDPPDDLNLANPPANAALLDYLARGFIEHDFDMKWLHREILNSRTYQLSWVPNATNQHDERNFSRAVPRRLPAEVVWDMLAQALASDEENAAFVSTLRARAISVPGSGQRRRSNSPAAYALAIFGRSVRESNCDCDRSAEPSLLQTIFLRNDDDVLAMIDARDGWLAQVAKEHQLPFQPRSGGGSNGGDARRIREFTERYEKQVEQFQRQLEKAEERGDQQTVRRLKRAFAQRRAQARKAGVDVAAVDGGGEDAPANGAAATADWNAEELITEAWLRTLSRAPTSDEVEVAAGHLRNADDPVDGLRTVLWALVNTKEFLVNH